MNGEIRPFELLKLIRDRVVVNERDLGLAYQYAYLHLEALQKLGWIETSEEGGIKPTARISQLAGLRVSLTQLASYERNTSIVANPLFGGPGDPPKPSDLFVIMPFDKHLQALYSDHIQAVAKRLGITSTRADDFFAANSIISDIWNAINHAKVVVADCTGRNPNVFYELGIAHTLGKPVILIAQDNADIPFDIQHIRYIIYKFPKGMSSFEKVLEAYIIHELEKPRTLADFLNAKK